MIVFQTGTSPTETLTTTFNFTVDATPTITSVSPMTGANGDVMTVTGSGFGSADNDVMVRDSHKRQLPKLFSVADLHRNFKDACPHPLRSNFLRFHAVSGNFSQRRFPLQVGTPFGKSWIRRCFWASKFPSTLLLTLEINFWRDRSICHVTTCHIFTCNCVNASTFCRCT